MPLLPEHIDLDQLALSAKEGDKEALEVLLRALRPRLYCMSMRFCHDHNEAEEVAQDALLGITRHLDAFRGACSITTWSFTIVRTCYHRRLRRARTEEHLSLDHTVQLPDPCEQPDAVAASRELWDYLQDALLSLAPAEREVLLMREREGMKAREISEALEISVAAVKSRLHRARTGLRGQLAQTCAST